MTRGLGLSCLLSIILLIISNCNEQGGKGGADATEDAAEIRSNAEAVADSGNEDGSASADDSGKDSGTSTRSALPDTALEAQSATKECYEGLMLTDPVECWQRRKICTKEDFDTIKMCTDDVQDMIVKGEIEKSDARQALAECLEDANELTGNVEGGTALTGGGNWCEARWGLLGGAHNQMCDEICFRSDFETFKECTDKVDASIKAGEIEKSGAKDALLACLKESAEEKKREKVNIDDYDDATDCLDKVDEMIETSQIDQGDKTTELMYCLFKKGIFCQCDARSNFATFAACREDVDGQIARGEIEKSGAESALNECLFNRGVRVCLSHGE